MSTVRVDNLIASLPNTSTSVAALPLSELRQRTIKDFRSRYSGGSYIPGDTYNWALGMFADYAPASASSRIRTSIGFSYSHENGHAISHWIFYANGVEIGRHSIAGQSPEHRHLYVWDFASWGTSTARIGYQVRRYGGSNQPRIHATHHWDGVGSNQSALCIGDFSIEEYFAIP